MKQRCKKCRQWVEGSKNGVIDRATSPIMDAFNTKDGPAEKIGEYIGLGRLGRIYDKVGEIPIGFVRGIGEALFGERFYFCCSNCQNEWTEDDESKDESDIYAREQRENKLVESLIDEEERLRFSKTKEEKLDFVNKISRHLSSIETIEIKARLFNVLAFSRFDLLEEVNKALDALDESIKMVDAPNTHALKGVIMGKGRTPVDKYKVLQELIKYDENASSDFLTPPVVRQHLEAQEQEYVNSFMSIPYTQRKFIVFDSELRVFPDSFKVLSINNFPTDLQFTEGHPVEQQIYICHPHNNRFYLPIDESQLLLFYDEIKELCELLGGLGARRIEIKDSRESEEQSQQKRSLEAKVGGEYKGYGANIEGSLGTENQKYLKVRKELCRIQEFSISATKPCVPEGLVWYSHRVDWQRIANQRLNGTLYHHHDYLYSAKHSLVSDGEKKKLAADFNMLIAKGGVSSDIQKDKLFKESINATWELIVDFYPLDAYEQKKQEVVLQEYKKRDFLHRRGNIILGCIITLLVIAIILLLF